MRWQRLHVTVSIGVTTRDADALAMLFADECEFDQTSGHVGSTRDEIIAALEGARSAGWSKHTVLGAIVAGDE
jgi:hypothetical protein